MTYVQTARRLIKLCDCVLIVTFRSLLRSIYLYGSPGFTVIYVINNRPLKGKKNNFVNYILKRDSTFEKNKSQLCNVIEFTLHNKII